MAGSSVWQRLAKLGKAWEWVLIGVAALLAGFLWYARGSPPAAEGFIRAEVTVVPSDRDQLNCAWKGKVEEYRCEFSSPLERWPDLPPELTLAPYLTVHRELYLIVDLFHEPSVAKEADRRARAAADKRKSERFTVHCRLRLLQRASGVRIRFKRTGPFTPPQTAWVAVPETCTVDKG